MSKKIHDVISVEAHPGYILKLKFDNGEARIFDMSRYIEQKPWVRLKDKLFFSAFVELGTVVWPGNVDIDPETLYELSE